MSESNSFMSLPTDKFKTAANKLLNECFLVRKLKETSGEYYFVLENREAFSSFFELLGYELIVNEEYGVITVNNALGTGRIHLKKIESILLLIIRMLYIEKRKQLSQIDDVIIIVDEIYDKYAMLNMSNRLDKTTMRSALGLFKRYHLITNLDSDMSNADTRIKIQPSILLAITPESLEDIYRTSKEKLEKYAWGDAKDDEYDEEADEN